MLSAVYITKALLNSFDKRLVADLYSMATSKFNQADSIDIQNEKTWIGKGILLVIQKNYDRALFHFDSLLEKRPKNIPCLLGKVRINSLLHHPYFF